MTERPDFDHTSFAVDDAMAWARRLRRDLGAVPIAGEALGEFRYLLMYVGTAEAGGRVEFIEPTAAGFLTRHLDRRGEGPHHITFTVPDLRDHVAQVRELGLTVTGEDYSHASWQEAFIAPDIVHGLIIQLAQSDTAYPTPRELLAEEARDVEAFPSSAGATDKTWWIQVWDTPTDATAVLGATHLGTTEPTLSRRLFEEVLEAQVVEQGDDLKFSWPHGSLVVHPRASPGLTAVEIKGGPVGLAIGPVQFNESTTKGHDA